MSNKKRVLLTASYGPNNLGWGEDMYDLMKSRLARGHGIFALSSHFHYFGLYLIAENLSNPTTVLENPHWEEFVEELKTGYDVVGFQLKSLHTDKVARMVRHIRENYPNTEIVMGGYGVSTLHNPPPGDVNGDAQYIRENSHHFCREEGVGFMRRILDDKPFDREVTQYHMPTTGFTIEQLDMAHARIPIILVALGCPNACDFCNTTAFFHNKKIYVAEPEQTYRYMKNYQRRLKSEDLFTLLFDEDIFLNAEYVRELGRLIRSDKKTWGFKWFGFGSLRSLSQFTAEEMKECGNTAVWIGVESFCNEIGTTTDTYSKRSGESIEKRFADLQRVGIQTIASLVMGFDFHDHENMKSDIDKFVSLKPTFYQLSPLTPCPGTPLYERMIEENRIKDGYKWSDFNLWKDDAFKLKNFKPGEIKTFFDYAHRQLEEKNGPPPMQMMEEALNAHLTFKNGSTEFQRHISAKSAQMAMAGFTYLKSVKDHHPSPLVRAKAVELERRYKNEVGRPPLLSLPVRQFISAKLAKEKNNAPKPVVSDPPPRWSFYHTHGPHDNVVYVRKGRDQKTAKPYADRPQVSKRMS